MPYFVTNPFGVKTSLGGSAFGPFETQEEAVKTATQLATGSAQATVYEAQNVGTVAAPSPASFKPSKK